MKMVQRKVVSATIATLTKACRNHIPNVLQPAITRMEGYQNHISHVSPPATTLMEACRNHIPHVPPPPPPSDTTLTPEGGVWKSYGNPCLDTFYYLLSYMSWTSNKHLSASHDFHMKRLLPHAWSYSPLATLKIIRHLEEDDGPMYNVIYWLHQNHPKTLAANLIPLLINFPRSEYMVLKSILYRIVDLKEDKTSSREKIDKVLDMYEQDPNFRCLHDEIAQLFAESLKYDIENFLKKEHDYDCDKDRPLEVTDATKFCERFPFLLESVAKRVFPHVGEVEEAVELLRKEVLDPLKKVLSVDDYSPTANIYGYKVRNPGTLGSEPSQKERSPVVYKYLKDLEESLDKMVADALLPNELVECLIGTNSRNDISRQVVELQWKAMVEDLKKKKGDLSSSLAFILIDSIYSNAFHLSELACAMAILFSELTEEEAWKGKVITLAPDPQLSSIQGHDLKSKCDFLHDPAKMRTPVYYKYIDCKKVLNLILDSAVSTSVKPEQMLKKVFVFSMAPDFKWVSSGSAGEPWEVQDYDEMRRKYREHGYDIPQIVFWRSEDHIDMPFTDEQRGISAINGFHRACSQHTWAAANFIRMFLKNDGSMSPQHVMDAILSDEHSLCTHPFVILD